MTNEKPKAPILEKPNFTKELNREVTERSIVGDSEQHRKLRGIGKDIAPEGHEHVGSVAFHIYRFTRLDGTSTLEVRSQRCLDSANAGEVSAALYLVSQSLAKSFGWEPSGKQKKVIKEL